MAGEDELWSLTKSGRQRAKNIYSSSSGLGRSIIAYLYETGGPSKGTGTASTEELALHTKESISAVSAVLRRFQGQGLVEKVG